MRKFFILPEENAAYADELFCARERVNGRALFASLSEISVEYLEHHKIDVLISTGLPREWYYILKGMNIVSITLGEREQYYELADIVIDCKHENVRRYFVGSRNRICGNPEFDFTEVADLIKKLDWDSDYFGFNIAYLSCMHLTENIYQRIDRFIRDERIRLVEYLCNCHDARSVRVAEDRGFRFTDIRLTFERNLDQDFSVELPEGIRFSQATAVDIPRLRLIAADLYEDSRYIFDPNFAPERIDEFYRGWVEKGVLGRYDDECWCLYLESSSEPFAFCTVRFLKQQAASIGLVGLDPTRQGNGYGRKLLYNAFVMLRQRGVNTISVVTQGRNYAAQNLYLSAGFRIRSTQLWYHKWI